MLCVRSLVRTNAWNMPVIDVYSCQVRDGHTREDNLQNGLGRRLAAQKTASVAKKCGSLVRREKGGRCAPPSWRSQ